MTLSVQLPGLLERSSFDRGSESALRLAISINAGRSKVLRSNICDSDYSCFNCDVAANDDQGVGAIISAFGVACILMACTTACAITRTTSDE